MKNKQLSIYPNDKIEVGNQCKWYLTKFSNLRKYLRVYVNI